VALVTSYSSLLTTIQDYLARSDAASFAPNMVQNWEEGFFRNPRNVGAWMDESLNEDTAGGVLPVPAGFLLFRNVYVSGHWNLDKVSPEQLFGRYPRGVCTGVPVWYARCGANFEFGPEPDATYTIKGLYRAKPDPLRSYAGDAADHWLIQNAPDLVLYGCLAEGEAFYKNDGRIATWKALYLDALKSYRDLWFDQEVSEQEVLA
jgi:hypothetical protein